MLNISINLTDLPKSKIVTGKDGKKYINLTITKMKEPDKFEKTHTVFISQSKEEREKKEDKIYVGKGKEFIFSDSKNKSKTTDDIADLPEENDNLPF